MSGDGGRRGMVQWLRRLTAYSLVNLVVAVEGVNVEGRLGNVKETRELDVGICEVSPARSLYRLKDGRKSMHTEDHSTCRNRE